MKTLIVACDEGLHVSAFDSKNKENGRSISMPCAKEGPGGRGRSISESQAKALLKFLVEFLMPKEEAVS